MPSEFGGVSTEATAIGCVRGARTLRFEKLRSMKNIFARVVKLPIEKLESRERIERLRKFELRKTYFLRVRIARAFSFSTTDSRTQASLLSRPRSFGAVNFS